MAKNYRALYGVSILALSLQSIDIHSMASSKQALFEVCKQIDTAYIPVHHKLKAQQPTADPALADRISRALTLVMSFMALGDNDPLLKFWAARLSTMHEVVLEVA